MYFQKKSKVAILLVVVLFLAGAFVTIRNNEGGITGAITTQVEESSSTLSILPTVETTESPALIEKEAEGKSIQGTIHPQDSSSIGSCQALVNGRYVLTGNVSSAGTCFHILNNSIDLDCVGYRITYATGSDGTAINNTGGFDHIIIRNCDIIENVGRISTPAITFSGVSNSTIENNKIVPKGTFAPAIILENSDNNTIRSNNITTLISVNARFSIGILFNESRQEPTATHDVSTGNLIINNNFTVMNYSLYFQNYTLNDFLLANNTLAYNNSLGAINWTNINLTTSANLSMTAGEADSISVKSIIIGNNVTGIADLNITTGDMMFNINTSARIEIKNLSYYRKTPGLFKRGVRCDNSTDATFRCNISSFDSAIGILSANVTSFSNYSTIFVNVKPLISPVILNTTNISLNHTNVNLTAYANATDNDTVDSVKVIYNWLVNETSIAVVNMPFEGINGSTGNNTWDYSDFGLHGNNSGPGPAIWNSSGGYDGKGAYMFKGSSGSSTNDYISLGNSSILKSTCVSGCTMGAWVFLRGEVSSGSSDTDRYILSRWDTGTGNSGNNQLWRLMITNPSSRVFNFVIAHNGSMEGAGVSSTCSVSTPASSVQNLTWLHVMGRYNLTHTAIFVNGTQQATTACSFANVSADLWTTGNVSVLIGGRWFSALRQAHAVFNGTIDDVMIFNRSLSSEQIFALWQNKTNTTVAQETAFGENWTVQATPNDGYEDGTMNQSGNVTILNSRPTISSLVLNTTNISRNDTNVNLTVYVSTSDADIGQSVKVIYNWLVNDTPIALLNMPFEGINNSPYNNAWDYSGFENNGSEENATWNATGGYDSKGAYEFQGDTLRNERISIPYNESFNLTDKPFTVMAWMKHKNATAEGDTIICQGSSCGSCQGSYTIQLRADSKFEFQTYNTSQTCGTEANGLSQLASNTAVAANTWNHVAGVYNGTNLLIYVNGLYESTLVAQKPIYTTNAPIYIGWGHTLLHWNGTIDEVMVFNRSLSSDQIFRIFKNESSSIVLNETIFGQNWSIQATPNDGLEDGAINTAGNVTILDKTVPTVNITFPTNGSNLSAKTVYFNATISDSESNISIVVFIFNSSYNLTASNSSGTWNVTVDTSILPEGLQGFRVFANDSFNNTNSTQFVNFTVDRTAPLVHTNYPSDGQTINGSTATFNGGFSDNTTSVQSVIFQFSNGTGVAFNKTGAFAGLNIWGITGGLNTLSMMESQVHTVTYFANDSAGNMNSTFSITVTVDNTPPYVTITNPANWSNFSSTTYNFNATIRNVTVLFETNFPGESLLDTVLFQISNGSTPFNRTPTNRSGTWNLALDLSTIVEGQSLLTVFANDTVNNMNSTQTINFLVDRTPPNVTLNFVNNPVNDSNFSIRSNNKTFNASIFDNITQVNVVYFWFDNGTGKDFNVTPTNISGQWTVSYNVSTLAEGRQGLRIVANDTVNNINNSAVINFTVDFSAPLVTFTTPAAAATLTGSQVFNATIIDNLTAVQTVIFQFSNGTVPFNRTASNSSGVWNVSVDTTIIAEGALTVTVFANDTVGNLNSTQTLSLTVDNVAEAGGGGGGGASGSESTSSSTTTSPPSTPPATPPSTPTSSQTASVSEVSSAFQSGQSSVSISSTGGRTISAYSSEQTYKLTISNNLNKKLVLSGTLKEEEEKLEFEENARKRLQEELLLEGEIDEAALEEELGKLKLLEGVELWQAHKKFSHIFPESLVGSAIAPPLIPSRERINGNLLRDSLLNAEELQSIVVNPGETIEKEVKIRRGLTLGQKEPPKIVFSSGGEQVLIKDIAHQEELVTGTAIDIDPKTKKLDFYIVIPPQQRGGRETFTVELNINTQKIKKNPALPLKISLPFLLGSNKENIHTELYGPYTVNLEKGALIVAQYDTHLPAEYEVVGKVFNKKGLISENTFEIKQ